MPLLYESNCRDRQRILESFYPFKKPSMIEGMIIGNDLDAMLSAALLKQRYDWNVVAVYDYRTIWYDSDCRFIDKLKSGVYIAVDLDIYRNYIPSIGHHILELTKSDCLKKHEQSLNPNFIFGVTCQKFRQKYPLGTVHFLRWLFEAELERHGELLCWLADSAYINAQSHRFRENVARWLYHLLDWPPFWEIFILLDSVSYEEILAQNIGRRLESIMMMRKPGQVRSRHKLLSGWQCQWSDPVSQSKYIRQIFNFINEYCDWRIPELPEKYKCIKGCRKTLTTAEIRNNYHNLNEFLERENVFSYVFTHANLLNYTRFFSGSAEKS